MFGLLYLSNSISNNLKWKLNYIHITYNTSKLCKATGYFEMCMIDNNAWLL